jgi:hypothetical protein
MRSRKHLLDLIVVHLEPPPAIRLQPDLFRLYVAIMSHGLIAHVRNSLKPIENDCDMVRHKIDGAKFRKCLILLAIPAGLEPATRGVEIRYSIQLSYGTGLFEHDLLRKTGAHPAIQSERQAFPGSCPNVSRGLHSTANVKNPPLRQRYPNRFS